MQGLLERTEEFHENEIRQWGKKMTVIERNPVPFYEVRCPECTSKIRFWASEVSYGQIQCPVCGIPVYVCASHPVGHELPEGEESNPSEMKTTPDVRKVLHGLEDCSTPADCDVCPYQIPGSSQCICNLTSDALVLLKKFEEDYILLERARRGEIILDYPTPEQRARAEQLAKVEQKEKKKWEVTKEDWPEIKKFLEEAGMIVEEHQEVD